MKKTALTILCLLLLIAGFYQPSSAQQAFCVFRNDGRVNAFSTSEVDSIVYSRIDLDSTLRADYVTQEIHTPDSIYRIPLELIDSVGFCEPSPGINAKIIKTLDYQNITYNGATLIGSIEGIDSGDTDYSLGFEYKASNASFWITEECNKRGNGEFNVNITSLQSETEYKYRAYIRLGDEKIFGEIKRFTTCIDDTSINISNLIGLWEVTEFYGWSKINGQLDDEWTEPNPGIRYDFKADGTIIELYQSGTHWHELDHGTWSYENGIFTLNWVDDEIGALNVTTLTSDTLVLEYYRSNGQSEDFERTTFRKIY